jgi:hypothetical protein
MGNAKLLIDNVSGHNHAKALLIKRLGKDLSRMETNAYRQRQ